MDIPGSSKAKGSSSKLSVEACAPSVATVIFLLAAVLAAIVFTAVKLVFCDVTAPVESFDFFGTGSLVGVFFLLVIGFTGFECDMTTGGGEGG